MKTIRHSLALLVTFAGAAAAQGQQSPEAKDVMAVVTRVFDGMKEADSAKVRTAFAPGARFVNVGTRANPDTITYSPVDGWLAGIAGSNKTWEEKVKNVRIVVDGNIASAWMDYTFHLNGALRHCGADSIELVKVKGEWKITQLVDTRRTTGCEG
jgi:hypothetical protein